MSTINNSSAPQTKVLWIAIALLGAVAFAIVALNRGEAVNAAWLVVAAICIYLIAYRFYGLFVANRALGVDGARQTPAVRHNDGLDYVPTNRYVLLRPSFRSDRRRGSIGRSGACGTNGLSAGYALDSRRRGVCRGSSGHDRPVSFDSARWSLTRRHCAWRDGTGGWRDHRNRHSSDLRHRPCGPRPRCR